MNSEYESYLLDENAKLKDTVSNRDRELTRLKGELGREQQRVRDLQRVIGMRDQEITRLKSGPEKAR